MLWQPSDTGYGSEISEMASTENRDKRVQVNVLA